LVSVGFVRHSGLSKQEPDMTQDRVITWLTHKTAEGQFLWVVYSFGYQIANITLKEGTCITRERATRQAQKWVRYLKAQQRKAA
jgi:hypothetical protein